MCPQCASDRSIVTNSRKQATRIYRRRRCRRCMFEYSTLEFVAVDHPLQVIRRQ